MTKPRSLLAATLLAASALCGTAHAQSASVQAAVSPATPAPAAGTAYVSAPVARPMAEPVNRGSNCNAFEHWIGRSEEACAGEKIGLGRGDFMVRLSGVGVLPMDRDNKHVSASLNGGQNWSRMSGTHTGTTNQAMPELTLEYFLTDNLSLDLIATSTRHEVSASGGALSGITGHHQTDLGSAWVLPPTLTVAWHFRPHKRFNPYVGVGGTAMWFHNMNGGNLWLGNQNMGKGKLNSGFTGGPSVNVGFDYQVVGNWFLNVDVKQMFVRMHAWEKWNIAGGGQVKAHAKESLDPLVVSAGIAYRF
ncbi:OmpW family protein [Acetobacter estunensis]|uniref:OmpW/AlkL family protein n=1 Tax=Acetobacter estunensis TaxID=104097 RepID=UPI001C2D4526|nr:OmpW family outer membrane protein [Acetobacter estunensis]MBV1837296.1 outer membrane beta-barrel protein [Acetobacter estunensis]